MDTSIPEQAVMAIYYDADGNAILREDLNSEVRSQRVLGTAHDMMEPTATCPPGTFECRINGRIYCCRSR